MCHRLDLACGDALACSGAGNWKLGVHPGGVACRKIWDPWAPADMATVVRASKGDNPSCPVATWPTVTAVAVLDLPP